jgi:hypothetical protein
MDRIWFWGWLAQRVKWKWIDHDQIDLIATCMHQPNIAHMRYNMNDNMNANRLKRCCVSIAMAKIRYHDLLKFMWFVRLLREPIQYKCWTRIDSIQKYTETHMEILSFGIGIWQNQIWISSQACDFSKSNGKCFSTKHVAYMFRPDETCSLHVSSWRNM